MVHGRRKNITQNAANNALVVTQNGNAVALVIDSDGTDTPPISLIPVNTNTRGDFAFGTVRTSDASSPSEGDFWYNATDNRLRYYDGATTKTTLTTADLTLQGAYDGGSSILETTAQGDVSITVPATTDVIAIHVNSSSTNGSFQEAVRVTRNSTTGSGGSAVILESTATNGADYTLLDLRRTGTTNTIGGLRVAWGYGASLPVATDSMINIQVVNTNFAIPILDIDTSVTAGGGSGIVEVTNAGAGSSSAILMRIANTASNNTGTLMQLSQSSTTSSAASDVIDVLDSSTGTCITIDKTGEGMVFDINQTGTASTSNVIEMDNAGTGTSIKITQNGNGICMDLDKTNTGTANFIDITNSGSGNDIEGHADQWRIDRRGHALLSSVTSKLKDVLNSSNTFKSTTRWDQIAVSSAQGGAAASYSGVAHDSRYIYYSPNSSDTFIRYDTTTLFGAIASWQQIAMSSGQGGAAVDGAYVGGPLFDGRYIYYCPFNSDTFVRFDTDASFTSITSWSQLAMSSGQGGAAVDLAYQGASFDGRYLYYVPRNSDTFTRYDTYVPFADIASWTQLAMSSGQGGAALDTAYGGATFDGRYIYYCAQSSDTFVRYDTTASFTTIASWQQIAMSSAQGNTEVNDAYVGAVFDGRYVYYVPASSDTFVRFDTTQSFTSIASWQQIAMSSGQGATALDLAYVGATFDGRYICYAPYNSDTFVRYDTTASFTAITSWEQIAMSSAQGAAAVDNAYNGATFDGRYAYYAAEGSSTFVRFTANNTNVLGPVEYAQVSS